VQHRFPRSAGGLAVVEIRLPLRVPPGLLPLPAQRQRLRFRALEAAVQRGHGLSQEAVRLQFLLLPLGVGPRGPLDHLSH
jgi:hypothetical protein